MGAYALEDHKLVHRLLGISRLLSFDRKDFVVARQLFNRPVDACKCIQLGSDGLVADVESVLLSEDINDAAGYIVWLDYEAPKDTLKQINEFKKLVGQFKPNDIVRVTVNASFGHWAGDPRDGERMLTKEERGIKAHTALVAALGEFMPGDLAAEKLDEEGVAKVLSQAYGIAANQAVPPSSGWTLEPLSVTRYKDGQQMLSMTSIVTPLEQREALRSKMGLDNWPFASAAWSNVRLLAVPDLTVRERLYLERNVSTPRAQINEEVGFDFDVATEMRGFMENFRRYYRVYPALSPVEL
jgi:hypothetical protein